jgi:hypothetical protein
VVRNRVAKIKVAKVTKTINVKVTRAKSPNESLGHSPVDLPLTLSVGGRLGAFTRFWRDHITNDPWALEVVEQGHSLEFLDPVPRLSRRVKVTSVPPLLKHVMLDEISGMLSKDAIEKVDPATPGLYSSFFIVSKKNTENEYRPILNLKPLNKHIAYKKFRMETNASILENVRQGCWLASLDLKDAFFHVPILPAHRPYLRFAFDGVTYQYKVLPFGLTSAPRVFTKVLAPLVSLIHQQGIEFYPYLDDCLLIASSAEILRVHVRKACHILLQGGFLINLKSLT